jgi:nucleotide-binding universal stress UspA family protein
VVPAVFSPAEWHVRTSQYLRPVSTNHGDHVGRRPARRTSPAVADAIDAERRGVSGVAAVEQGKAHREIVEYANENDLDCAVMGTHGRDAVQDVILGNVTERLVRTSNVPVLLIRE